MVSWRGILKWWFSLLNGFSVSVAVTEIDITYFHVARLPIVRMDTVTDENIDTLCCMGFVRESAKQALRLAKNDLNEAVAILTGDHPTTGFDTLYGLDSGVTDNNSKSVGSSSTTVYGPSLPPSYNDAVEESSSQTSRVNFTFVQYHYC